jgi:hypothetical protein
LPAWLAVAVNNNNREFVVGWLNLGFDNIYIVNGVIHDVMPLKKKEPVFLQIYDYKQMLDAINLEQAASDIYDAGMNDDNLALIYKANSQVKMAVNTPNGISDRKDIENVLVTHMTMT